MRNSIMTCLALLVWTGAIRAEESIQFIDDDLTGGASRYDWIALDGACLTAGNGSGSIPACHTLPYYRGKVLVGGKTGRLPDAAGSGALRLTNGDYQPQGWGTGNNADFQRGAVVSKFTFPNHEGIELSFSTVTYGGDGYEGRGADGLSFFLADGARTPSIGSAGGALGYSCSNVQTPPDGVEGGYLGIGIDEYGNFSNAADGTNSGPGHSPNHIVVRGAGDTNWDGLKRDFGQSYLASAAGFRNWMVRQACRRGLTQAGQPLRNYAFLRSSRLPGPMANQHGVNQPTRGKALPITYAMRLTQHGRLSLHYSYNGGVATPVFEDVDIVKENGVPPATLRFGFAASTGAGSNVHEITCFKAKPASRADTSAAVGQDPARRTDGGPQFYFSAFNERYWTGKLTAVGVATRQDGRVELESRPRWDAACRLTGGTCDGVTGSVAAIAPEQRTILTWDGTRGVPWRWQSLSAAQRASLGPTASSPATGERVLDYLRGARQDEVGVAQGGTLRRRQGLLGDISHSSPTWVGAPDLPYDRPWQDRLHPAQRAAEPDGSYAAFSARNALRQHVVYVGANDGMMHGFRAGGGQPIQNDGVEILAYMPSPVVDVVRARDARYDLTSPSYAHNLFVDATAGSGDLYYGGAWHTWLVGGLGGGARADGPIADDTTAAGGMIYALDITDPAAFREAGAGTLALGEWSSARLNGTGMCNVANCGAHLGMVHGKPLIRRLHNGKWAVLFGNGYNSAHGSAGLFVMIVDPARGASGATFRYLDTGHGPAQDPLKQQRRNGIVEVTAADLDEDHITDYVYAGDLFGNVWRFDLTDTDPAKWRVRAAPHYATGGLPITTAVLVSTMPARNEKPRVMMSFGTGRRYEQTTYASYEYARGRHGMHGVWDADLDAWNARAMFHYASLPGTRTVTAADLQVQTVERLSAAADGPAARAVSTEQVCWQGDAKCRAPRTGWRLQLPGDDEQVLHDSTMIGGMLLFNTTIPPAPAAANVLSCAKAENSGYSMAVRLDTGGASARSFFDVPELGNTTVPVSGVGLDATGTPTTFTLNGKTFMVQQTEKGVGKLSQINPDLGEQKSRRVNWARLR
ncbi:pilus assembly protein [Cupriavidus plantarum]|uniref:pilus assembly protein n=1 Tax=Cupriavidus plantarum TaxID=942865 RepID=UPI000F242070|nr:PilC/PilY family type IV pilus protein [Cupriavidus plantarum]RLK39258.1 type IV pilus assembly protein PilY1 [Cupriavidus plantarum]